MKYLLSFFVLVSLVPNVALADIVPDNQHVVNSCVLIENQASYPEYNFWLTGTMRGYGTIKQLFVGENCDLGGMQGKLIAIKKTDQPKVKNQPTDANAETYVWPADPVNQPLVIDSHVQLAFEALVPNTSRVTEKHVVVHIDMLTDREMKGRTTRVTTQDDRGQVALLMEDSGAPVAPPAPVNTQAQPTIVYRDMTNYWVVGELAIFGIIGLALLAKSWKK